MKNQYKIIICLSLLFSLDCSFDKENSTKPLEINIATNVNNFKKLKISDFFCDVTYILLDSVPISLGQIYQLNFNNNMIAVRDLNQCVLYNQAGSFISKIGIKGNGPNEYSSLGNIRLGSNNRIFLQDFKSIMEYNLKGNFIRKFDPEINYGNITIKCWTLYNDSLFFGQIPNITGQEKYKGIIFDSNGKTIKLFKNNIRFSRETLNINSYDNYASIYRFNGQIYFKEMINDTLFIINDEMQLELVYYFNLGKYSQPIEERKLGPFEMIENIENYIFIKNIFDSKHYLFFDCNFGKHSPAKRQKPVEKYGTISEYYTNSVLGVFDKNSGEVVFSLPIQEKNHFLNTGFYNDFDNGLNFYPRERVNDSTFAMWIYAYILKEHIFSDTFKSSTPKYPEKKKELEKLANSLNENDNPVLMLVKLKD